MSTGRFILIMLMLAIIGIGQFLNYQSAKRRAALEREIKLLQQATGK